VNDPVLTVKVIDVAADAVVENEDVRAYEAELTVPFTNEAVVAKDELIALAAQLLVPNVEPLWVPINEPVNEPVLTLNVIDVAADAVVENEDVNAYEAELTVPFTNEAVVANDDEIALFAQLAVPNVDPL
jgi:N-acetylglucosamine kinase-like BadF-type ATPase